MTDRELLELAAKAAGIEYYTSAYQCGILLTPQGGIWNPLTDDGDALRLAVKLRQLRLSFTTMDGEHEFAAVDPGDSEGEIWEPFEDDPYAATRRAIVRAAAAIGAQ